MTHGNFSSDTFKISNQFHPKYQKMLKNSRLLLSFSKTIWVTVNLFLANLLQWSMEVKTTSELSELF